MFRRRAKASSSTAVPRERATPAPAEPAPPVEVVEIREVPFPRPDDYLNIDEEWERTQLRRTGITAPPAPEIVISQVRERLDGAIALLEQDLQLETPEVAALPRPNHQDQISHDQQKDQHRVD